MALQAASKTQKTSTKARVKQEEFPVDNYPCRVSQVIDLGRHYKDVWNGATSEYEKDTSKPPVNMLMVTYEFTTEFMKDENGVEQEDRPRWLSERFPVYALDSDLATSTKRYNAFDPTHKELAGDWSKVAGMACSVAIAHKKNGKAKIGNVAKPMKGMQVAELKNPVKVFDLSEPDMEVFGALPQWLQDEIKTNLDFAGSPLQAALEGTTPPQQEEVEQDEVEEQDPDITEEDEDNAPW